MRNGMLYAGIALAFLAGGLATYGYDQATKSVEVVAAQTPIAADTPITADELTTISINEETAKLLHAFPSSAKNVLIGQYLNTTLPGGLPVMGAMTDTVHDPQALINRYAAAHGVSGLGLEIDVKGTLLSQVQAGDSVMLFVPPSRAATTTTTAIPSYHLTVPVLQVNQNSSSGTSFVVFLSGAYLGTGQNQATVLNSLLNGQVLVAPYSTNMSPSQLVYVPGVITTGNASVLATTKGGNNHVVSPRG